MMYVIQKLHEKAKMKMYVMLADQKTQTKWVWTSDFQKAYCFKSVHAAQIHLWCTNDTGEIIEVFCLSD